VQDLLCLIQLLQVQHRPGGSDIDVGLKFDRRNLDELSAEGNDLEAKTH
jgi:hypothetical protein